MFFITLFNRLSEFIMSVEIKETSATVRTLEITIPQADLTAPFEKKLNQYKKQ